MILLMDHKVVDIGSEIPFELIFKFLLYFISFCYAFVAAYGLSLVVVGQGSSLVVVCGLLIAVASLVVGHRL